MEHFHSSADLFCPAVRDLCITWCRCWPWEDPACSTPVMDQTTAWHIIIADITQSPGSGTQREQINSVVVSADNIIILPNDFSSLAGQTFAWPARL